MEENKCILILSDEDDISTADVMDWIHFYGKKTLRINESTKVWFRHYRLNENNEAEWSVVINDHVLSSGSITNYWYRRGVLVLEYEFVENEPEEIRYQLNKYLNSESNGIYQIINSYLNRLPNKIGNIVDNHISKTNILRAAEICGLETPKTLITSEKTRLVAFLKDHPFLITKAITEGIAARVGDQKINGFTTIINEKTLEDVAPIFFPTLFQEGLEKKWELRVFYLKGKCYSSAIFSQKDDNTKIDFRHYGTKFANRTPPIKLPEALVEKIHYFMVRLNIQSGSLDFVYTTDKRYVFLEVNPVGQFAQVSDPCNYCLEEKIALALIQ